MFFFAPLFFPVGTSEPTYYEPRSRYAEPTYVAETYTAPPAPTYMTQTTYATQSAPGYYYTAPVTYYYPPTSYVVQPQSWPVTSTVYSSTETRNEWVSTHNRHWREKDGTRMKENVLTTDSRDFDGNYTKTTQKTTTATAKDGTLTTTVETTDTRTNPDGKSTTRYLKKVNDAVVEDKTMLQSDS